jgi:uncharacterized coiled-coil protein SlyX
MEPARAFAEPQFVTEQMVREEDVTLTTASPEARMQVQSFAAYINRISSENVRYETRITALEARVEASRVEIAKCNDVIEAQRLNIARDTVSLDDLRAENIALKGRVDALETGVEDALTPFYDDITYDTARCPILLTSGRCMGIGTVLQYWLNSPYFDGKATSMFQCPLSRQLVRVQDMSVVKMVNDLAGRMGVDITSSMRFQYDINVEPAQKENYVPRWETYGIDSQLQLMATLIALYRDRRFGKGRRTAQVNETHTITMNMAAKSYLSNDTHGITFCLSIVRNGISEQHMVMLKKEAGCMDLLPDFNFNPAPVAPVAE